MFNLIWVIVMKNMFITGSISLPAEDACVLSKKISRYLVVEI